MSVCTGASLLQFPVRFGAREETSSDLPMVFFLRAALESVKVNWEIFQFPSPC